MIIESMLGDNKNFIAEKYLWNKKTVKGESNGTREVQGKAYNAVNYAMVEAYWLIGRPTNPISGKQAKDSAINDRQIAENLLHPLSWTHIQRIMRVIDPKARAWYWKTKNE